MSGGSYNYVCQALGWGDMADIYAKRHNIEEMATDMIEDGYKAAAVPLLQIIAKWKMWEATLEAMNDGNRLYDMTKAYEWWKSHDSDQARFEVALAKYVDGASE